ncbi:MAG: T9SS type A sorting domain-containing protein [Bacteroidales bacterium]|nr:T9SS type A sorting domain-containing protein [Bacteroidales bacterium]
MKRLLFLTFLEVLLVGNSLGQPFTITSSIPYNGSVAGGTYLIYRNRYTYNITMSNIRKPLIFVEGFDPNCEFGFNPNYLNPDVKDLYRIIDQGSLASSLHVNGYDIIILNFNNGGDYIQRNAFLLVELINQINAQKPNTEPLVVVGYSMGGLVARYALTYMEQHGMDHKTRLYVSFDSPHKGAHVPVGLQELALGFDYPAYLQMFPDLAKSLNMFKAPAAKQMLKYRLTSFEQENGDIPINSDYLTFFSELNSLNSCSGFPQNCRNIAISLGNWNGRPQRSNLDYDNDGNDDFQHSAMPMVDINIPRGTGGSVSLLNITPCQAVATFGFEARVSTIYSDNYPYFSSRGTSFWNLGSWFCTQYWYVNPNNNPFLPLYSTTKAWYYYNHEAMDFAPGSYSPIGGMIVDGLNAQINCSFAYISNNTFIPTVSALCFDTDNLFYDIGNDANKQNKNPFDAIYGLSTDNSSHLSDQTANAGLVSWLLNQISTNYPKVKGCCYNLPTTLSLSGPSFVCSYNSTFTVNNLPSGCSVAWSNSSNLSLSYASGNTATYIANGSGSGWVQATIANSCSSIPLTKISVTVGNSTPSISAQQISASGEPTTVEFTATAYSNATYNWYVNGVLQQNEINNVSDLYFPCRVTKTVKCSLTNSCGTSAFSNSIGQTGECIRALSYSVSPNPASSTVTLTVVSIKTLADSAHITYSSFDFVRVFDLQGNLKKNLKFSKTRSTSINVNDLKEGTYIFEIGVDMNSEKHQVIIRK